MQDGARSHCVSSLSRTYLRKRQCLSLLPSYLHISSIDSVSPLVSFFVSHSLSLFLEVNRYNICSICPALLFSFTLPECKLGSAQVFYVVPLSVNSALMWDTALLHSSVSVFTHGWAISVGLLNIIPQSQKYCYPTLQTANHTNVAHTPLKKIIKISHEIHLICQVLVPFTNF